MITDKNRDFLTQYGSKAHIDELIKDPRTSIYSAMNNPAFDHTHSQKVIEANHPQLQEMIYHPDFHKKVTTEQITQLTKSKDPKVIEGISGKNLILQPHHIENLMGELKKRYIQCQFCKNMGMMKNATPDQFDRMIGENNLYMNQSLSRNRSLPEKHIPKFINSSIVLNRMNIAGHPKLTPEHMEKLSDDENEFVRSTLAKRKDLPIPIIHKLAEDPSQSVRSEIFVHHSGK